MRYLLLLISLISLQSFAQYFPESGPVFDDSSVPTIDIYINPTYLDQILAPGNESSTTDYPASFVFTSGGKTESVTNVGFRLRGNTSRYSQKKSFKVSFNSFENQKFHELEKLNLNGEHNDPSICRSTIFWKLAAWNHIPGSRINHVNLYINGQYKGVYVNVEHIDEEFVELRFGNKDGNLYKCTYPADLKYINSNPNSYKLTQSSTRVYELQTNTEADDYSDLAQLIHVLAFNSGDNLRKQLEPIFNVRAFLKYYAFEVLTGHWDGYAINKNNFYLYHNTATGQFEFIPYDGDNTFGIDWFNEDWAKRDIHNWEQDDRPLVNKILAVPEYRSLFNFYVRYMLEHHFNPTFLNPILTNLENTLAEFIPDDPYYPLDYGYDLSDFHTSFTNPVGNHVKYGIKGYISTRYTRANSQLRTDPIAPMINQVIYNSPVSGQLIGISAVIEDEDDELYPWIIYEKISGKPDSMPMYNDGLHADGSDTDTLYAGFIPTNGFEGDFKFYIQVTDASGKTSRNPFSDYYTLKVKKPADSFYINEVMADNENDTVDSHQKHEDWLELFNYNPSRYSTAFLFLSDDETNLQKWALPELQVEPFSYLHFWCDEDEEEGENHTNFKLNNRGETIFLSYFDGDSSAILDVFPYTFISEDKTAGRYPNGIGPIQRLAQSSPEASNVPMQSASQPDQDGKLIVSPNPFDAFTLIQWENANSEMLTIQVFNSEGRLLLEQSSNSSEWIWDGKTQSGILLKNGIYIIKVFGSKTYQAKVLKMSRN